MPNIKLEIEYEGGDFCGWQIQRQNKNRISIQESLENTLSQILQEKINPTPSSEVLNPAGRCGIKVIASGRTDSGVHALGQVVNFKTTSLLPLKNIQKALNSLLPKGLSIQKISYVKEDFHSRYSAKSKTYSYIILNSTVRSAFYRRYSWHIPYKLNIKLMRESAASLLGSHDFSPFCASGSSVKDTVRTIKRLSVTRSSLRTVTERTPFVIASPDAQQSWASGRSNLIIIEIEADGFLYNMVRRIVGTLVEIGRGRYKKGHIRKILKNKDKNLCGLTAPAKGLFLVKVTY